MPGWLDEEHNRIDDDFLRNGKRKYLQQLTPRLQRMTGLLASNGSWLTYGDAVGMYGFMLSLKGNASMFGFSRIGTVAGQWLEVWGWINEISVGAPDWGSLCSRSIAESQAIAAELNREKELCERELDIDEQNGLMKNALHAFVQSRLLIIDTDDTLREYLVNRLLMDGCTAIDEASDIESAKRLLREHHYDLILLDLMMYPQSGYEIFEFLQSDPVLKWVPLIVMSVRADVQDKVRCFFLGAVDFVTKPFAYEELVARIYGILHRTQIFEKVAFRDPLTGVYNRRYFDHQIQTELQRISRHPVPISLVFMDIDRFKAINDTYGHHIGDLVLQGLAGLLQNNLRSSDLLARLGGEEFVVVMPNTSGADAHKVTEYILSLARQEAIAHHEGEALYITFSAGVAEWRAGMTLQMWVRQADASMYLAKQQGRNQVVLSVDEMNGMAGRDGHAERCKKIVVAAADPFLRSILISRLQLPNVDIAGAANGEEACQLLSAASPADLCIVDELMTLDGFGMLEKLQDDRSPQKTKVLMLSSRAKEIKLASRIQIGFDDFMIKPFSMVDLEQRVKKLLDI
ncbi:diguanylate cyclase [Paenibacillus thalictri]|uniref:Diguanylate cyclase n=1 Tax=Paenibacillus thalictri TaxID=2527873 RepID=A0A4V2J3D7_9BACL|nr:diguanylate cyclase [Paenibacillus thalictri]TBL71372.1 diguanylate cyclase [Paenibacillus thalictri]